MEVVGTVQQVHSSRRRLFRRGLQFHVCIINKSARTKKSLETYLMILVYILDKISISLLGIFNCSDRLRVDCHHDRMNTKSRHIFLSALAGAIFS